VRNTVWIVRGHIAYYTSDSLLVFILVGALRVGARERRVFVALLSLRRNIIIASSIT